MKIPVTIPLLFLPPPSSLLIFNGLGAFEEPAWCDTLAFLRSTCELASHHGGRQMQGGGAMCYLTFMLFVLTPALGGLPPAAANC